MGKGDMKTRRGKLFSGSYGRLRPRKKRSAGSLAGMPVQKKSVIRAEKPEKKKVESKEVSGVGPSSASKESIDSAATSGATRDGKDYNATPPAAQKETESPAPAKANSAGEKKPEAKAEDVKDKKPAPKKKAPAKAPAGKTDSTKAEKKSEKEEN